jgi:hypothetical protein
MTKQLPFTQERIKRAVAGVRSAGLEVTGIEVRPDGTVVVLTALENAKPTLTIDSKLRDARERLK